jgi:ribosomal protein S18 acetylase RimI-like enzyme
VVNPAYRRRGVARQLLEHVEKVANDNGKYLLVSGSFVPKWHESSLTCTKMLDVPVGTIAEQCKMYEKAGYIEVGTIPNFSISPRGGSLVDEKFFFKDLRK